LFHQKWGAGKKGPAPRLEGNTIEYMQVGGRTTAWVPALQKLTGQAAEKPKSAKKKASESNNDAAAPAPKQPKKRAAPRPTKAQAAAGMLGHLSRRLLHTRIMI
jgi:formamidopyrimidine-DNA glycosylase